MSDKELGVAIIHGIGSPDTDFADGLIAELRDRVTHSERIAFCAIHWADVLRARQKEYIDRARASNDLDYMLLRRFLVSSIADATAYRRVDDDVRSTYGRIHEIVRDGIAHLFQDEDLLAGRVKPLVVLAHSLGGQIMSNYIWDIQKNRPIVPPGQNRFERMRTLRGIITFGCSIPLFTFALRRVVPIRLPEAARWINYYDPDDVLAYPLKPINQAYRRTVSRDVAINVGSPISSWNPASHTAYWTDNSFTKPVARFLSRLL